MKKILGIINIILLLAAMMPLCVACSSKGENLPMPEYIVIYNGGKQITLQNGDEDFSKAYALFHANLSMGILETAIEDEMIDNAKQEFAAEFIYDDAQAITTGDITESVTGVFFFMSEYCEGEAAFSNGGNYHSGTFEFSCNKSEIKKIAQAHEDDIGLKNVLYNNPCSIILYGFDEKKYEISDENDVETIIDTLKNVSYKELDQHDYEEGFYLMDITFRNGTASLGIGNDCVSYEGAQYEIENGSLDEIINTFAKYLN